VAIDTDRVDESFPRAVAPFSEAEKLRTFLLGLEFNGCFPGLNRLAEGAS
jgi:hypothetical protein